MVGAVLTRPENARQAASGPPPRARDPRTVRARERARAERAPASPVNRGPRGSAESTRKEVDEVEVEVERAADGVLFVRVEKARRVVEDVSPEHEDGHAGDREAEERAPEQGVQQHRAEDDHGAHHQPAGQERKVLPREEDTQREAPNVEDVRMKVSRTGADDSTPPRPAAAWAM